MKPRQPGDQARAELTVPSPAGRLTRLKDEREPNVSPYGELFFPGSADWPRSLPVAVLREGSLRTANKSRVMTDIDSDFVPGWRAFALGSLPILEPRAAWDAVLKGFPEIPFWPQLPRRSHLENMYTQFSERFPGLSITEQTMHVDRRTGLDQDLERLYLAYLEDDLSHGRMSATYAAGLDLLLRGHVQIPHRPIALKGHIIGPVSWGLTVLDQNRRPVLYDEILADAVSKHLRLKAAWQEEQLRQFAARTIVIVDEPYLASFGSAFVSLSRNQVVEHLEEVFAGLKGLKGVHCCGNTEWSILLSTSTDILSLDAYDYGYSLTLYASDVAEFLERGGIIAWGIVPAGIAADSETATSLVDKLHETFEALVNKGIRRDAILQAGMITPSCGLGSLTPTLAQRVLDLTTAVSAEMRQRYVAPSPRARSSPAEP